MLNSAEVPWEHLAPYGPVVVAEGLHIEGVAQAFFAEQAGHLKVGFFAEIMLCRAYNDIHPLKMLVLGTGQVLGRVVVIHVIVVVAVHKLADIEGRTHGEEVGNLVGVAEGKIQGLITAKTAPGHRNFIHMALKLQHRDQFLSQKLVVENMVLHAHGGRQVLGVPRMLVDAINAEKLDPAGLHQGSGRFDKLKVAGLILMTAGSRENDDWVAPSAKHQHVDILTKVMRIKATVLFLHGGGAKEVR